MLEKLLRANTPLLFLVIATLALLPFKAQAGASPWVPMEIEGGSLYIETKIAGIKGYSMIDTGANINLINEEFLTANSLKYRKGKRIDVYGVFGQEKRDTYRSVVVELFGNETKFGGLVSGKFGGDNVQLILGATFLSRYVFQFDYPNARLRVFDRKSVNLKKSKNIVSRSAPNGEPIVKVGLNKQREAWLLLDTGNSLGIILDRSIAVQEDWITTYPTERITGFGATNSGELDRFNIPTMQIGPFELENPIVAIAPKGQRLQIFEKEAEIGSRVKKLTTPYQGILGYDVLKHFVVTIDYKRGLVHLLPGSVETN